MFRLAKKMIFIGESNFDLEIFDHLVAQIIRLKSHLRQYQGVIGMNIVASVFS